MEGSWPRYSLGKGLNVLVGRAALQHVFVSYLDNHQIWVQCLDSIPNVI